MTKSKVSLRRYARKCKPGRRYPGVEDKVVDHISHSIEDGTLCVNVSFKDKTLLWLRFACDMFIVSADLSDWKTGDYEMIREYMKPIPR
jgi:hypothetical protein